jgi:hypothetical protein
MFGAGIAFLKVEVSHMAKKAMQSEKLTPEIRRFLSENGKLGAKKGGAVTRRLVELGKQAAIESGEDVASEVEQTQRNRRRAA